MTAGELRDLVRSSLDAAFGERGDAILARVDRWIWASVAFPTDVEPDKERDHEVRADWSFSACVWCARGWQWASNHLHFRALGGGRVQVFASVPGGHDFDPFSEEEPQPTFILCGPCVILGAERLAAGDDEVPDAMVFAEAARAISASGSPRTDEAIAELERRRLAPPLFERRSDARCRLCRGEFVPVVEGIGNRATATCADCLSSAKERYRYVVNRAREGR